MQTARLVVNADLGRDLISRHIYGHFAEHLGRCIYDGIYAGEDAAVPNTRGIRDDVVAALRGLAIPNLRWPGGCFADEYHWRDGIGPKAGRPTMLNTHWGGVTENNHFGTHEFMDLCALLGCEGLVCEPYICGNVGSGTVAEMQQWVEYLTADGGVMADLRRANGRVEPWKVTYWGVGNENWGCGGRMRPEYYADLYRRYSTYVRNLGENRIFKIACGPNRDNYRWTEVLMREAGPLMDGLSMHYYTRVRVSEGLGSATAFDEEAWFRCLHEAAGIEPVLQRHMAIMDQYDPERRVALIVDEWGTWHAVEPGTHPRFLYQQNTLRDALVAGLTLNIFNRYAQRIRMANIAQTVNVLQAMILTERERMLCTPSYHVFEMYRVHQDATLLPCEVRADAYVWGEASVPAVSASASRDTAGRIHLTLCNLDPRQAVDATCHVRGAAVSSVSGRVLTADAMQAHNTFDQPDLVRPAPFAGAALAGETLRCALPPMSVVVLELA
ncbi:MAG: alpha-N-arabinofuranosidase [Chloroflexota bacterium]